MTSTDKCSGAQIRGGLKKPWMLLLDEWQSSSRGTVGEGAQAGTEEGMGGVGEETLIAASLFQEAVWLRANEWADGVKKEETRKGHQPLK